MGDGPHLIVHEGDYWSNTSHGDRRLTWRELAEDQREQIDRLEKFQSILFDLDRCEHGRHQGDLCAGCGGHSRGNPFLPDGYGNPVRPAPGTAELHQIGFNINGRPIIVPPRDVKTDPTTWRTPIPAGLRDELLDASRWT